MRCAKIAMSEWKRVESPKLLLPFELREVTSGQGAHRIWEVQELRRGAVFKVHLEEEVVLRTRESARSLRLDPAGVERAVCLAVEEALLEPPDKEPGVTYEIFVSSTELAEALETAST